MPETLHGSLLQRLQCLLGLFTFMSVAWLVGAVRTRRGPRQPFPWRVVGWGLSLQFLFAAIVLQWPQLLRWVSDLISALLEFTRDGASMVFGSLANEAASLPVTVSSPDGTTMKGVASSGAQFAFFILPTIVFFSALTAIAYHIGLVQIFVQALAWVMSKTMRTSGAETLSAAANIFVGQTEAPLVIKPFLLAATRSELMCIMVAGFANIASGVLGVYTAWLKPFIANAGGHLAAACFISAPASLLVSKLMVPETDQPETGTGVSFGIRRVDANLIDAATRGTSEGVALALNVGAMLITFTALVAMVNAFIGWKLPGQTLQSLLSYPLAPVAWLTGCSWSDSRSVGSLIGVKTVLNELIAYAQMKDAFAANPQYLSPRSALIALYALCGFANIASIGIQVGGIATLAPTRRTDLSRLGVLALLGGALASHMTAAVVGVLL